MHHPTLKQTSLPVQTLGNCTFNQLACLITMLMHAITLGLLYEKSICQTNRSCSEQLLNGDELLDSSMRMYSMFAEANVSNTLSCNYALSQKVRP